MLKNFDDATIGKILEGFDNFETNGHEAINEIKTLVEKKFSPLLKQAYHEGVSDAFQAVKDSDPDILFDEKLELSVRLLSYEWFDEPDESFTISESLEDMIRDEIEDLVDSDDWLKELAANLRKLAEMVEAKINSPKPA